MSIPQDILNFVQYLTSGGPNGGPLTDSQVLWERRQSKNFDAQWRQAVQFGLVNDPRHMGDDAANIAAGGSMSGGVVCNPVGGNTPK